jgi:hypothetical protein
MLSLDLVWIESGPGLDLVWTWLRQGIGNREQLKGEDRVGSVAAIMRFLLGIACVGGYPP